MQIKALVFDCFGVVVGRGVWNIYELAGGNLEKDGNFVEDVVNKEALNIYSSEDFHKLLADKLGWSVQEWLKFYRQYDTPNNDVLDFIESIHGTYKTALVTNAANGVIQNKLNSEQLQVFDSLIISSEVGVKKPDPKIYTYAASALGLKPQECLFIDDHMPYVQGALDAGMQAVHYKGLEQLKAFLLSEQ